MKKMKKAYIGTLRLLANACLLPSLRHLLFRLSGLKFGKKTFINMGLHIIDDYENLVEIGNAVALSPNINFIASSNPNFSVLKTVPKYTKKAKIVIGDNSWIGTGAVIMPGITIGKMAIVGSNAVVTKHVNDYEIVAGVPAKVIGKTNENIELLNHKLKNILVTTSSFPLNISKTEGGGLHVFEISERISSEFEIFVLAPLIKGSETVSKLSSLTVIRYRYFLFKQNNLMNSNGGIAATLSQNKLYYLFVPYFFISQFFAIRKYVKKHNIEIIHAHWLIPQGIVAVLYKKVCNKNIKIICTSHGSDLNKNFGWIGRKMLTLTLRHTDSLTVVSQTLKEKAISLGYNKPIEVVPMGIDTHKFKRLETEGIRAKYSITGNILLFAGSYVAVKGIEYLLHAMPAVLKTNPNTTLIMIGNGILKEKLQQIAEDLHIANKVVFTGFIANDDMPVYFSTADVVIIPSLSEGCPVVMAEAFACSSLVITSDIDAFQNHIRNGVNGFMVPVKNSDALAKKIIEVLDEKNALFALREEARNYAIAHFDWEMVSKEYVDLINNCK